MSQDRGPYRRVGRVQNRCNSIDTHEILKNEIMSQGGVREDLYLFGTNAPQTAAPIPVVQTFGFEDTYIYFDSQFRNLAESDYTNGVISFDLVSLNYQRPIENIVQIKMSSFWFPKYYFDTATYPDSPNFFFFRRVYARILEAPSTSVYSAANGRSYHFEFDVSEVNSVAVLLTPVEGMESFYFPKPINSLSSFTLQFFAPLDFRVVPILQDRVAVRITAPGPSATATILSPETTFIFGQTPLPAPGTAIMFTEATSATLTRTSGYFIDSVVSATDFTINATLPAGAEGTMFVMQNRLAFGVRFTSLRNINYNYLTPVHT